MNMKAGLWIDHRKAVIVLISPRGEETMEIQSNIEKHPGRGESDRSSTPYEASGSWHAGIGGQPGAPEADELELAGGFDALAHGGGRFAAFVAPQFRDREGGCLDVKINPVKERSADAGAVALDLRRGAPAFVLGVAEVAAGAFVRCQCAS